jgi:Transposase IS66 family
VAPRSQSAPSIQSSGARASPAKRGSASRSSPAFHRGLARNLLKVWPALWTFVEIDGVEPTNNRAERGLRHAVIYRKLSHGERLPKTRKCGAFVK